MRKLLIILSVITLIGTLAACGIKGPPKPPPEPESFFISKKFSTA